MVGVPLITAGVVMLVTPGPGWLVIIIGLAVLASEFAWAERALGTVRRMARRAAERALDPRRRRRNQILLAVTALLACVFAWLYIIEYGFTLPPLLGGG